MATAVREIVCCIRGEKTQTVLPDNVHAYEHQGRVNTGRLLRQPAKHPARPAKEQLSEIVRKAALLMGLNTGLN